MRLGVPSTNRSQAVAPTWGMSPVEVLTTRPLYACLTSAGLEPAPPARRGLQANGTLGEGRQADRLWSVCMN